MMSVVVYLTMYIVPKATGDIGRLCFVPFGKNYFAQFDSLLPKDTLFSTLTTLEELKAVKTEVLTIGDSFSARKREGYQNFMSLKGINVANCDRRMFVNQFQFAYNILKCGYVDSTNTKYILVECAERGIVKKMKEFKESKTAIVYKSENANQPKVSNIWSLARARDFIMYKCGLVTPILETDLDNEFFSCPNYSQKLFFMKDDLHYLRIKEADGKAILKTYKTLYDFAESKHIKLLLLVAVDKYDLYQNKIVNNHFPKKEINEDMRRLFGNSGSNHLIFSKDFLLPHINKDEKDVFWANDTHWSTIGAEIVANGIVEYLN